MAASSTALFCPENKSDCACEEDISNSRVSIHCPMRVYPTASLIVLPNSIVCRVCTFLVYPDFDKFVKCSKEILTACIPSWQSSKNKNDNNSNNSHNKPAFVNNGTMTNEHGLMDNDSLNCYLQYTRSMARIQCNNLIIELTRYHSDYNRNNYNNNNNNHNKGSKLNISNIGSTIRSEFDTLYDHLKFVIPKSVCHFENDEKLAIVTMGLNQLNDHLGSINHIKYACILEFIDLIFYLISKRKVNSFNDCIKQILHKLAIGNDYSLSLLTIIERYGMVELSEITFEKASGIVNIEDIDAIFAA